MSDDRNLIEAIKAHFARKSSAQLQAIAEASDQERWSPEAIAAAGELLQERMAGRAPEPLVAEEERPDPAPHPDPFSLAFLGLGALGGLSGFTIVPVFRVDYARGVDPDVPVPFGPKMAWLALDTNDTAAVARALGLRGAREATWKQGIDAAAQGSVFVTPPLADWTLAVSTALFPPDRAETFVKPLVERLSRKFGDAQYFCTHPDVELHLWARARQGRLVRGYGWLGQRALTLWDEGAQTKQERALRFDFSVDQHAYVEQHKHGTRNAVFFPDERCVMQLAALWSVDPSSLDEQFKEPAMGLLDAVPRGESRES
jgi:hypothetical protein